MMEARDEQAGREVDLPGLRLAHAKKHEGAHDLKFSCEDCGIALPADSVAYVCSYECTFCETCFSQAHGACPHCGGELARRPRRAVAANGAEPADRGEPGSFRSATVWTLSFGVWSFVALAYAAAVYQLYRSTGMPSRFLEVLATQSCHVAPYALLTPFVIALAHRYPLQRANWGRRLLVMFGGGLVFSLAHVVLRGVTPFGFWDSHRGQWVSAVWNYETHSLQIQWAMFKALVLGNVVDDVITIYLPIVLVAYVASYYRRNRERELRTSQLQAQLEKARLEALKSQLQPHFLFNTLNSISALMLTNVAAADRMITRLGDLLRLSLETAGTQMTTLGRELEFVNCYIEIEKVRFEERLKVIVDVDPETLDASVPHLVLQPLVDNAIKHGISKLAAGGEVRISARRNGNDLRLEVKDNGPGFAERPSLGGVGLRVTRERLETIYGQDQSVELLAMAEGGVVARVTIPFGGIFSEERAFPLAQPVDAT